MAKKELISKTHRLVHIFLLHFFFNDMEDIVIIKASYISVSRLIFVFSNLGISSMVTVGPLFMLLVNSVCENMVYVSGSLSC